MKAASKRFIELLASLALFAATIGVYAFLLKPAYTEVNELRGELAAERGALREQQIIVEKVKMALAQYQDLSRIADTVSLVLPLKEAYPTLTNQLDTIAKSAGVFLESINFNTIAPSSVAGNGKKNPVPVSIQLTMNVIGPYSAFKDFLSRIETNVRIMDVVKFSVTPALVGQNFAYNLIVNTYYQSP